MHHSHHSPDIGKVVILGPRGPQHGIPGSCCDRLVECLHAQHPSTEILLIDPFHDGRREHPCYPVCATLNLDDVADYLRTARNLSKPERGVDVVCLQFSHDYFGGEDGEFILTFLTDLKVPVSTTLHRVPPHPSGHLKQTFRRVLELSDRVVVTNRKCRLLLEGEYGATPGKIDLIRISPETRSPSLRDQVTSFMASTPDTHDLVTLRHGFQEDEKGLDWETIADAYHHNFLQTIIDAQPAKRDRQMQPWPWVRMREFSVGSECRPGWET